MIHAANFTDLPRLDVQDLVDFVERYFSGLPDIMLEVHPLRDAPWSMVRGHAHAEGTVRVWLSPRFRPHLCRIHRLLGTPEVWFRDWREAFVYVLSHEMAHHAQFADGEWSEGRRDAFEVDADWVALQILGHYRRLVVDVELA